jgi:hypothetical protein
MNAVAKLQLQPSNSLWATVHNLTKAPYEGLPLAPIDPYPGAGLFCPHFCGLT